MAKKITCDGGALLLLALLILNEALATTMTTIVSSTSTVDDDEDNQQCQKEIQTRIFPNCQTFLELEFETAEATILMLPSFSKEYYKKHCCEDELSDIDDQCVCYSVRSIVRNMMDTGRLGADEMLEMLVLAGKLPVMCKIRKNRC